jgi:hypothetical protein
MMTPIISNTHIVNPEGALLDNFYRYVSGNRDILG